MKRTHLFAAVSLLSVGYGTLITGCKPATAPEKSASLSPAELASMKTVTLSVKGMH